VDQSIPEILDYPGILVDQLVLDYPGILVDQLALEVLENQSLHILEVQ
jgi:hypothetical protein